MNNPWLVLWIAPRSWLRKRLDRQIKERTVLWLTLITGLLNGCVSVAARWGKYASLSIGRQSGMIFRELIVGAIAAFLYLYLLSWAFQRVGRWLQGQGRYHDLYVAIGWSFYPWGITAIIGILAFTLRNPAAQTLLGPIYFIVAIWSFVVSLKLLGEAHRFSVWRAFATFAIVLIAVVLCLIIISGIASLVRLI